MASWPEALRREVGSRRIHVAVVEPNGLALRLDPGGPSPASPTAEDVADAVLFVLTRPPHLSLAELFIRPTG